MALIALSEPCVHIVASDDRVVGGEDVHQHWRSAEDPSAVAFMTDLIGRTEEWGEDVTFRFERLDGDPCSELTCDNCGYADCQRVARQFARVASQVGPEPLTLPAD